MIATRDITLPFPSDDAAKPERRPDWPARMSGRMFPPPREIITDSVKARWLGDAVAVMGWIVFDGPMTVGEIARRIRMDRKRVGSLLAWLKQDGRVRRGRHRTCTATKGLRRMPVWEIEG